MLIIQMGFARLSCGMTYDLFIGDRTFSSWSLRGWLMFEKFNIPFHTQMIELFAGTLTEDLRPVSPAHSVPVMRTPQGDIVGETLAMAETLAELHPEVGMWPKDASARMLARWMSAEMHAGFPALRRDCPMQLIKQFQNFKPAKSVRRDLKQAEDLWALARTRHGHGGPWLFGSYSLADVFFAPVAARIAGYGLPVGRQAAEYVAQHLNDLAFRRWRAMGLTKVYDSAPYALSLPTKLWPGPKPLTAVATNGPAENTLCPYSGDSVTDFMEIEGRTFGFSNPYSRDKTLNDPEAWPDFMAIYHS